jgi:hypothetical protein
LLNWDLGFVSDFGFNSVGSANRQKWGWHGQPACVRLLRMNRPFFSMTWNVSRLGIEGTLWLISTASPVFQAVQVAGNKLIINGTGGTPNWPYAILATANLALPQSQWMLIGTNFFDGNGNFTFTNMIDPTAPQTFVGLRQQ